MNFACELMDSCRGTPEVEAVLSGCTEENEKFDPLERLKMAMQYEEKKVSKELNLYVLTCRRALWPA